MRTFRNAKSWILFFALAIFAPTSALAADTGTIKGAVTVQSNGSALHKARVLIVQLSHTTETDENGAYQFLYVPPGAYDVAVQATALGDQRRKVEVTAGGTVIADFQLAFSVLREQVTVTASGREETKLEAFQAVNIVDNIQLVEKPQSSLGAALDGEPGVAKRSFGPGAARPVIRGFDGDRVLIMKDGISTGTLSSQSGDHGETIDTLGLERLEVVKGPATLLYGSNAIGGVVNAITSHGQIHDHVHDGISGYFSGVGGSANAQGGGGAGVEFGRGNWLVYGDVSGNRTGDYNTPIGTIFNSRACLTNGSAGFGRYTDKSFFNFDFGVSDAEYGIPPTEDEIVTLSLRRYNPRFTFGFRNLNSFVEGFRTTLDYSDYHHEELPFGGGPANTIFDNKIFAYRTVFDQRKHGRLTGSFGFSGLRRDYTTTGEEAIAPPVIANIISVFTLQQVGFEHFRLQFGGRVDHTIYNVQVGPLPNRDFTGFSGAAGVHVPLWTGGAFVVNYTHAYRAPALEELYNDGPHPGNATFEIGDPTLRRESSNGVDISLRHQSGRVRAEANFFYYHINHFVFLAPTGDVEDGLPVAEYLQANSRFLGGEANFDVGITNNFWLLTGMDIVDARLIATGTPLPRIPPLRGRVGFDFRWRGLSVRPVVIMARDQSAVFGNETRTAGYTVVDFNASYTVAQQHAVHVFSVSAFNLGDRLYRNHLSFIKDLAPEIGRGVRVAYTLRFF